MKYIDAEKLKEKIDEVRQDWLGDSIGLEVAERGAELGAAESVLDSVDDIIDSLQDEDLEKDFSIAWAKHPIPKEFIPDLLVNRGLREFIYKTAHHFYELGKNSKK